LLTINLVVLGLFMVGCHSPDGYREPEIRQVFRQQPFPQKPVDTLLSSATLALWQNLHLLKGQGVFFGQQDATLTGTDWKNKPGLCDILSVTGQYPAVYGWEMAGDGNEYPIDSVSSEDVRKHIIEAFNRGGINTISWHMQNPVTGGNARDTHPALNEILPDSSQHTYFKSQLQYAANFLKSLQNNPGVMVPVLFRPFHEANSNWFWWGGEHATDEAYVKLWRFTVAYLRDSLHVHNILYVYSTDGFESRESYLQRYPGDEWVDVLGCENYIDFQSVTTLPRALNQIRLISTLAQEKNKLAALTECGFNGIPVKKWWTGYLLHSLKKDSLTRQISYVMVWRNVNRKEYYIPHSEHKSLADFKSFESDAFTWFGREAQAMVYNGY